LAGGLSCGTGAIQKGFVNDGTRTRLRTRGYVALIHRRDMSGLKGGQVLGVRVTWSLQVWSDSLGALIFQCKEGFAKQQAHSLICAELNRQLLTRSGPLSVNLFSFKGVCRRQVAAKECLHIARYFAIFRPAFRASEVDTAGVIQSHERTSN
jgi:hypothetical protein